MIIESSAVVCRLVAVDTDRGDARRPVANVRRSRKAAVLRLGGREAMAMAPSQTCIQQSFIVCVLVRPWPRRRCVAAAAVCCREEATRANSGGDPWRDASLTSPLHYVADRQRGLWLEHREFYSM